MILYILLFLFSVFISSVSQIILKSSANKTYDNSIKEYLNPKVIIAYSIFFFSSLLTVFAYRKVPMSTGTVLETTGYVWVTVLGYLILKERVSKKKIVGLLVIIIGIVLSNIELRFL